MTTTMNETGYRTANAPHAEAPLYRSVATAQAAIYVPSGIWPILHRRSFEAVTGPKADFWLVRTVGGLIAVVGGVLGAGARKEPRVEMAALGAGTAAVLAVVDIVYVARRRIAPVYLLDATLELALVGAWGLLWLREMRTRT